MEKNPKGETILVDRNGVEQPGWNREKIMAFQKGLRTATVHETMGPNFKHIYWIRGRCMVAR